MLEYLMYIFSEQICMFGYLKTPDIMLSIVSSKKLDWTHTFDTHCKRNLFCCDFNCDLLYRQFHERYTVKHVSSLDFLDLDEMEDVNFAINKSNNLIMTSYLSSVFISDNSGKLIHTFERDSSVFHELSISSKNEIMISSDDEKAVNFYTEEGNLASKIELPQRSDRRQHIYGVAFHYVLDKIIVLAHVVKEGTCFLNFYSESGKLESTMFFCEINDFEDAPSIISHPGGPVAVVRDKTITFI